MLSSSSHVGWTDASVPQVLEGGVRHLEPLLDLPELDVAVVPGLAVAVLVELCRVSHV